MMPADAMGHPHAQWRRFDLCVSPAALLQARPHKQHIVGADLEKRIDNS